MERKPPRIPRFLSVEVKNMTELEKITEKLWDMYIGRQDEITELLEYNDDKNTDIRTGQWKYYRNKAEYVE